MHELAIASMAKRVYRCQHLVKRHAKKNLEKLVLSDECLFGVEESLNSQNVLVYSLALGDISDDLRTFERFQKSWYDAESRKRANFQ